MEIVSKVYNQATKFQQTFAPDIQYIVRMQILWSELKNLYSSN